MASPDIYSSVMSSYGESFSRSFYEPIKEANPAVVLPVLDVSASSLMHTARNDIPKPPPLPRKTPWGTYIHRRPREYNFVPRETRDAWDKLFKDGYGADVLVITEDMAVIPAHVSVLSAASPVLGSFLQQLKVKSGKKYIKIPGVPFMAVNVFIRFLYSSCFEEDEMNKFALHLLVLSHVYSVPALKRVSVHFLEQPGFLTPDNMVDVLQLAKYCDAPRLTCICLRMVLKDFRAVSSTEGWKVMKRANPELEQEILESVVEADSRKQDRLRKIEERKVYLQLFEAMEALLHICRDGCRTIGPRDKTLRYNRFTCSFPACKGLEMLVRHFSTCKTRVPGGCVHCKRMWQLLELHSRMCDEPDFCKVPLCRHFKDKMQQQSKKDEAKWKLLVCRMVMAKNALGPFPSSRRPVAL